MHLMETSPQPGTASAPITAGVLSAIGASACCADSGEHAGGNGCRGGARLQGSFHEVHATLRT